MLKKLLIAIALVIIGFVIFVATRPSEFRIERSALMTATPAVIFPQINNLQKWPTWSPWAKLDPNAKNTFSGPAEGKGAVFAWAGNREVGEGRMTITESKPNELVQFHLEFFKPMEGTSETTFKLTPEGDKTRVTWTMTGKNNFIGRAMCVFMDMDKMVGGQFETGLASMRALAEGTAKR
jgi:hypothetical protein